MWASLALSVGLAMAAQAGGLPDLPIETYPEAARIVIEPALRGARAKPDDGGAAGRLAMALHAWEQWDQAHAVYRQAQRLAPRTFDWFYLDGVVLARQARPADAAAALRQALEREPDSLPARVRLAEALFDAGDLGAAAAQYEALVEDARVAPIARLGLGRVAARQGRHADAIAHLERAVALFPEFGPAHYALALSYRAAGRRDEARSALARHEELGPRWPAVDDPTLVRVVALKDDAGAQVKRGLQLAATGDLAGAIEAHEAALVRSPDAAQAHANLITLYGRVRNWAKAEEHYRAVVRLGFNLDDAHYNYGVLLMAQERWKEAEETFRRAIEVNPHHAQARNNLGQLLERDRNLEAAAEQYRQAVASQPGLRIVRFNLGRMLIALDRPAEAVTVLEPLVQPRDEETPRYLFALATANVRAGRTEEGLRLAQEAQRLASELGQTELAAGIGRELQKLRP